MKQQSRRGVVGKYERVNVSSNDEIRGLIALHTFKLMAVQQVRVVS